MIVQEFQKEKELLEAMQILSATITLKRWNNAINKFDIETIYINSEAVTVTNQRFNLSKSYEKLKHILNISSGEGSGWIANKIEEIHIKICNYDPLSGSSHIPLPPELNNSMKGLIKYKNKDVKCFKWCHMRFIDPQSKHFDRIKPFITETLDYKGINFPMKAVIMKELEKDLILMKMFLDIKIKFFLYLFQKKSNEQELNVLLISNEKNHTMFLLKILID